MDVRPLTPKFESEMNQKFNKNQDNAPKFFVSTFNAQSLSNDSYLIEFEHALGEINYDVIGLSEVKRIGEEVKEMNGYIFYYKGLERRRGTVGFAIKSKWKNNIVGFNSYSDRVITVSMKFQNGSLGIVQCYAPTSTYNDDAMEEFYQHLDEAVNDTSKNDWQIVMGDFNAKIGVPQKQENDVMGPFGLGERNDRGRMLIEFSRKNELFITNSMFEKRASRRWTWTLGRGRNEIDFILIRKHQRSLVSDVSVVNNFKFNSDHRLLRMSLKLKVKPFFNIHRPPMRIVVQREDRLIEQFNDNLRLQQKTLFNEKDDVQSNYDTFCESIWSSADPFRCKMKSDSVISPETRIQIELREDLKRKRNDNNSAEDHFKAQRKKTNRLIRRDVHKNDIRLVEEAIVNGKSWRKARNGACSTKSWIPQLYDEKKEVKSSREEVLDVAASYYEKLYKSTLSVTEKFNLMTSLESNSEVEEITVGEVEFALSAMKNSKATGSDGIPCDLFKVCDDYGLNNLVKLLNEIIKTEVVPEQWYESTIILVFKKGDRRDIGNYRPITLTSHLYKLFMKILLIRMTVSLDENQEPNQAGFRAGYSTTDHLFVMNQLIEKCSEHNKPLFCAFVDYTKAFDSIEHPFLWSALKEHGADLKYIRIIKQIYENSKARIKMETYSRWFNIERGIKQGDPFSPKAFNSALQKIFKTVDWNNKGIKLSDNTELAELRFADDVAVISEDKANLESMMTELFHESKKAGLNPNVTKTQIITNTDSQYVTVEGIRYNVVEDYIYLGQVTSFENQEEKQIDARIANAWKSYWSLKKFFKTRLPYYHKKRLFDACIIPVFTYGSQTRALTHHAKEKLAVAQRNMERSMMNIRLSEKVSNAKIRKTTKVVDVVYASQELKWNWAGHLCRYPPERLPKIVEAWEPTNTKRSRGRPKIRWKDDIQEHASCFWRRKAQNRENWKKLGVSFIQI